MLYTSPSAASRLTRARRFLEQQDPARPLLIVGPNWGVAEELVRDLPRATLGWTRLSWDQLLWKLCGQPQPLTAVAAWGCLQRALEQSPPTTFASLLPYPGFAVAVQRTLQECIPLEVSPGPQLEELAQTYAEVLDEEGLLAHPLPTALRAVAETPWLSPFQAVLGVDLDLSTSPRRRLWESLTQRLSRCFRVEPGPGPDHEPLATLRSNLFQSHWTPPREGDCLQVISASQPLAECQELVREMVAQARSGVAWDDMAVFLAQSQDYLTPLRSALQRAQVPAYFTQGLHRPDPEGRAFLTLLECARERLSARRFSEYLGICGHYPSRWQSLLQEASIIEGLERWQRCLPALAQLRQRQREMLERDEPEHPRLLSYDEDLQALHSLQEFATPVLAQLNRLSGRRLWGEWMEPLQQLAQRRLRRPQAILELLEQLQPLAGVGPVSLDQVLETLRPHLVELREPTSGHRYGKVFVANLNEAGGRTFRVVFLPGLAERRFPAPVREDPLLSDTSRREISSELLTTRQRSQRERLTLQMALGAAQERLVASFPRRDSERNRPLLPSIYLMELWRADRGQLPTPQQILESSRRPDLPAPDQAIDEVEEGLAWLRQPAETGERRFLIERNPWLPRAMRSSAERQMSEWKRADGYLGPGLEGLLPSQRAYSASALQRFAACPYQFFLYAAYRLDPRQEAEPLEELDALTRGTFVHELHAQLVWQPEFTLEQHLQRLAQLWSEQQLILLPQAYRDEVEQLGREFAHWLKRQPAEWKPIYAELAFQMSDDIGRDPASFKEAAPLGQGFHLRGSVDRVERNEAGELRVIDLKTGRPSYGPLQIEGGKLLQPALYALAVANTLGAEVVESSLEFCTRRGDYRTRSAAPLRQAEATALQALSQLENTIRDGALPARPGPRACEQCNYLKVCGPQASQWAAQKSAASCTQAIDWWRDQK